MSASRRHVVSVVLVALSAALAWWLLQRSQDSPHPHGRPEAHGSEVKTEARAPATPHPAAAVLAKYASPKTDPRDDLRAVAAVLDSFRLLAKGDALPLGSNEEISAALRGESRARLALLPHDHPVFDAKGRLVDRWGTPLFLHAQSAKEIEIRSAGPDLQMDTADDILHGAR